MRTRTLVIAAGLVVAAVGVFVFIRRTGLANGAEESAVQAILDKGGKVTRDEAVPGRPVTSVRLSRTQITDDDLRLLEPFPDLTAVYLVATSVTDAGLGHLRHLQNLRTLDVRGSPVTDVGLVELRHFPGLETLVLRGTRVTDAGLARLAAVPDLRELDLMETGVTDAGLRNLKGLNRLESLELPPACETETAFHQLHALGLIHLFAGMRTAENRVPRRPEQAVFVAVGRRPAEPFMGVPPPEPRDLGGFPISPAVVRELNELPNLKQISVPTEHLTDNVLRALAEAGRLHTLDQAGQPRPERTAEVANPAEPPDRDEAIREFNLSTAPVTDTGLSVLARLPNLERLNLSETKVTAKGVVTTTVWPRLRELTVTGLRLGLADLKALERRKDLTVHGIEVETSDESLKELRAQGQLGRLVKPAVRIPDLDESDDPDAEPVVRMLTLSGPSVTDAGLRELAGYRDFSVLEIKGTRVTGAGLAALNGHQHLRRLALDHSPVTDAGLKHLANVPNLDSLSLRGTKVTDAGLEALVSLTRLSRLDIRGTSVTEAGLPHLKEVPTLRYVSVDPDQITDGFLRSAHKAGLLHRLSATNKDFVKRPTHPADVLILILTGAPITDAGLSELTELTNLELLALGQTRITDAGVKGLVKFPLTSLYLQGTGVTDTCIDDLATIRTLRSVRVFDTRVTESGVRRLKAALPDCVIENTRPDPREEEPFDRSR